MAIPSIYADFMNADPLGRVRLSGVGTLEDLGRLGVRLEDGLQVLLHDDELETDGVIQQSTEEHIWVACIDWQSFRPITTAVTNHLV